MIEERASGMDIAFVCWFWGATAQRPHQLARQAILAGHRVTVLTSAYWWRRGRRSELHEMPVVRQCPSASALLAAARACPAPALQRPLEAASRRCYRRFLQRALAIGAGQGFDLVVHTGAPAVSLQFEPRRFVLLYDCLDRWEGFVSMPPMTVAIERQLAEQADLCCGVTPDLASRLSGRADGAPSFISPNGCDADFFARTRTSRAAAGPVAIGYVGGLHEWFDWEAVAHLATSFPEADVVLVGPCSSPPPGLPPNVRMTGPVRYELLPATLGRMDVCLIPFRRAGKGDLLSGVSPVKLYEYLAAGRPVVSCRLPDAERQAARGVVHLADSPQEFEAEVRACLPLAWERGLIEQRRQAVREHTWARRWQEIEGRVRPLLGARGSRAGVSVGA